jgi:hypothetical protein
LVLLDPKDGTLLKKWIGTERIMAPVVFLNDARFVLRTIANELYLF